MYAKQALLFLLSIVVLTLVSPATQGQDDLLHQNYALYGEKSVRKIVASGVLPEIPKAALKGDLKGKIIVAIVFDEAGNFLTGEVLESPHQLIEQPVLDALKSWRVAPRGNDNGLHKIVGWLTFDCVIENGIGHLEYAPHDERDYKQDQRYRHPFVKGSMGFYYRYH